MNMRQIREKIGLSQVQLANRLGVTQGAVSQWESGFSFPNARKLSELAAVLNCTVDELLKGEEKDGI